MQNSDSAQQQSSISAPSSEWSTDLAQLGEVLGPLDGRYRRYIEPLIDYLSEAALNRTRIHVEVEWLIFVADNGLIDGLEPLSDKQREYLRRLPREFNQGHIQALANYEAVTRHDVKAVEYLIGDYLRGAAAAGVEPMDHLVQGVHLLFTSEDVNNLSQAINVRDAVRQVWLPAAKELLAQLNEMAVSYAEIPMLAMTHGQPATPVSLGKEIAVFVHRLYRVLDEIENQCYLGKCNGATGNWAAHIVALPNVDWPVRSSEFIESLGLEPNIATTQIESHDWQVELFARIAHAGRIIHNLATDVWMYISRGYLVQDLSAQGSTGSSTMPHKVNPIRFENAEANLEVAEGLLHTLEATLSTSRMQRDLTDSSMQRNVSVAFGHSLVALRNMQAGLKGVKANPERMAADLEQQWVVLSEAIQQVMRVRSLQGDKSMGDPYARLKELTRGHHPNAESLHEFIAGLGLPEAETERLQQLSPSTYNGDSVGVVNRVNQEITEFLKA